MSSLRRVIGSGSTVSKWHHGQARRCDSGCSTSATAAGAGRWRPGFDFGQGFVELAGFFVDEALEVVAHAHAVVGGVGVIMPLLEPGEQFDQAGEKWNQAGVVGAAEFGLDSDIVGADRAGKLQVIVARPRDDR